MPSGSAWSHGDEIWNPATAMVNFPVTNKAASASNFVGEIEKYAPVAIGMGLLMTYDRATGRR